MVAAGAAGLPVKARGGFGVVEALTVALLLLLVLQTGWLLTAGMARAAAELADRAEGLAASRATAWILQEELDGGLARRDVSAPRADSIGVRAFRGLASVCAVRAPADVVVRWRGMRAPDPGKDSVLVLDAGGVWSARALVARGPAPSPCAAGGGRAPGTEERWTLDRPAPGALLVRYFERGSYHLADDAFRYRIGAGGRQPLSPPTIDPAASGLAEGGPGVVVMSLATRGSHRGRPGPKVRRSFRLEGRW